MDFIEIRESQDTQGINAEAKEAIERVISNRIVISYSELNQCFRIARGVGVGLHTIREWESAGMPHQHHPEDRYYFYVWAEVWAWYRLRGKTRKTVLNESNIAMQTWIGSSK